MNKTVKLDVKNARHKLNFFSEIVGKHLQSITCLTRAKTLTEE